MSRAYELLEKARADLGYTDGRKLLADLCGDALVVGDEWTANEDLLTLIIVRQFARINKLETDLATLRSALNIHMKTEGAHSP